jgi:hypothetical protein
MKMIKGDKLTLEDTLSPLLQLRLINALKSPKISSHTYLADLLRALTPWPGVWTTAPTTKGDMRISLESVSPTVTIKLAGKPNPIAFDEFAKYYL